MRSLLCTNEGILHEEVVDLMLINIELSGMEMTLVNVMNREFTMKFYLSELKKDYDYILIDCMPSLGMLTINALAAAGSVIIPVQAHYLPLEKDETKRESVRNIRLEEITDFLNHPFIILKLVSDKTVIIMAVDYYIFCIVDYFSMCSQSINILKFS